MQLCFIMIYFCITWGQEYLNETSTTRVLDYRSSSAEMSAVHLPVRRKWLKQVIYSAVESQAQKPSSRGFRKNKATGNEYDLCCTLFSTFFIFFCIYACVIFGPNFSIFEIIGKTNFISLATASEFQIPMLLDGQKWVWRLRRKQIL